MRVSARAALMRSGKTLVAGAALVAVFALAGSGQMAAVSSSAPLRTTTEAPAAPETTSRPSEQTQAPSETTDKPPAEKEPTSADRGKKPKPATGSFTEDQESYADGQVPKGIDPAVIVEAGEEACKKVAWIAGVDEKAAIQALVDDEIHNAPRAIRHLCPEFTPLLKKAGK